MYPSLTATGQVRAVPLCPLFLHVFESIASNLRSRRGSLSAVCGGVSIEEGSLPLNFHVLTTLGGPKIRVNYR